MKLAPRILENAHVRLEPTGEAHRDGLRAAATDDFSIFLHFPNAALKNQGFDAYFDWVNAERDAGRWMPHTVIASGVIVGQTCFMATRPYDRGVEIGGTWYRRGAQGGAVNPSCKLLLMTHAFESGAERVELKTDALNARSRAAILKLGTTFEGIHRHHMLRPDGTWRDTAWYSVLREEWPSVRAGLAARIAAFG